MLLCRYVINLKTLNVISIKRQNIINYIFKNNPKELGFVINNFGKISTIQI